MRETEMWFLLRSVGVLTYGMYVCVYVKYMSTVYVFHCKKTVTEYNSTNIK